MGLIEIERQKRTSFRLNVTNYVTYSSEKLFFKGISPSCMNLSLMQETYFGGQEESELYLETCE